MISNLGDIIEKGFLFNSNKLGGEKVVGAKGNDLWEVEGFGIYIKN